MKKRTMSQHSNLTKLTLVALLLTTPLITTACSAEQPAAPQTSDEQHSTDDTTGTGIKVGEEGALTLDDAWVKAGEAGGITSVFGTLTNHTDQPIQIPGLGSFSPDAESVEVHEVIDGKMRLLEKAIVIAPGEQLELEPGGHHLMLMNLKRPLLAGEEIAVQLAYMSAAPKTSDTEISLAHLATFRALVKDYAGANEEYEDLDHDSHSDHGSSDHDHAG